MTGSGRSGKPLQNLAQASEVLFRSGIEIARILKALQRQQTTLAAEIEGGERLFLTRLLHVDPRRNYFVTAFSDDHAANKEAVTQPSLTFVAHLEGARIEFDAAGPEDTIYADKPGIRFAFPKALIRSQRRRHARVPVPTDVSLRCVADSAGITPFEARIVDISLGGMGGMIYDPGIRLPPGTVLKGCKIVVPGWDAVLVDIEIRHTASVIQSDGSLALRSGVRFLRESPKIQALIDVFIQDLDRTGE